MSNDELRKSNSELLRLNIELQKSNLELWKLKRELQKSNGELPRLKDEPFKSNGGLPKLIAEPLKSNGGPRKLKDALRTAIKSARPVAHRLDVLSFTGRQGEGKFRCRALSGPRFSYIFATEH